MKLRTDVDHLCPTCRRRPRLIGERACGYCRRAEDLERFHDEGTDPYAEQFEEGEL